jgi:hypothetical protein
MATQVSENFREELKTLRGMLLGVPPELGDTPWRIGGWTHTQIVGHLLDSATNNRQRFVRASTDGLYVGPPYAQEAWVTAHGYAGQSWETLLRWWQAEHEILAAVVDGIAEDRLETHCVIGEEAPVSLRFLIEDYVVHQRQHIAQLSTKPE